MRHRNSTRGFNLVEAAIVLGVVGLVIGAIWVAAATVTKNNQSQRFFTGLMGIVNGIQSSLSITAVSGLADSYDLTSLLIQNGTIPSDWVQGAGVVHPFGGALVIRHRAGPPVRFDLRPAAVPQSDCINIVVRMTAIGAMGGPDAGGTERTTLGYISVNNPAWSTTTFPVSLQTATTACSQASNALILSYGYARVN